MDAEMMETIISSIRYWRLQKGISVRTISLAVSREEAAFGLQNLEKLRQKKRLTVPQFNDQLGLSKGHLHRVLAGYNQFGIKAWWRIADALHMDLKVLIGRE